MVFGKAAFFLDFLEKSIFFLEFFFRFLISGLEKSIFFLGFYGFLQKSIFFLGFFIFLKISFFPWVFWIFDLETQKSKHPFEESQKNPKKPWEIQKSIFLTWIQRFFLKRWIFGFWLNNPQKSKTSLFGLESKYFKLKDGLLYFCFHFLAEFRRLKKRINQEWLQLSFDLREQASYIIYVCFHGFSSFYIALIYIYICLSP